MKGESTRGDQSNNECVSFVKIEWVLFNFFDPESFGRVKEIEQYKALCVICYVRFKSYSL